MTLHDAIVKLLKQKGRAMSISEITAELNENKWFKKKDNSDICDFQVHGRTWSNSKLFRRDGNMVYLTDENTN
jgi:hypothetical protein